MLPDFLAEDDIIDLTRVPKTPATSDLNRNLSGNKRQKSHATPLTNYFKPIQKTNQDQIVPMVDENDFNLDPSWFEEDFILVREFLSIFSHKYQKQAPSKIDEATNVPTYSFYGYGKQSTRIFAKQILLAPMICRCKL